MSNSNKPDKSTIWTGAATTVQVLARLDMAAPPVAEAVAQRRADLHARVKRDLAPFTNRLTTESFRKRTK
jgi:hypothetical protein